MSTRMPRRLRVHVGVGLHALGRSVDTRDPARIGVVVPRRTGMTQTERPQMPIGYWLKLVDKLLTEQIDKAQAAHGMSRTEWQVFNVIAERGAARKEGLHTSLAPFADPQRLDEILGELVARGWVAA